MAEGTNTVTEKQFVDVEFDPFEELTTTRSKTTAYFTHAGVVDVSLCVSHHRSSEKNVFKIEVATEGNQTLDDGNITDAVPFQKIMILADQDPIEIDPDTCISYRTTWDNQCGSLATTGY